MTLLCQPPPIPSRSEASWGSGKCRRNPRTIMDRPSDHGHAAQRLDERRAEGAEWRRQVPHSAQTEWKVLSDRADPVEILIGQGKTRITELLPIRYARMKANPFTFLRGAAAIMAADLAPGPATGLRVQACGDCHLANFGAYAAPEGTPVFDVNDFDETLPACFEWDVKRLAVSLAVAGRVAGASDREARQLARTATKNYRRHLGRLALMSPLEAWSSRIDLAGAVADIDTEPRPCSSWGQVAHVLTPDNFRLSPGKKKDFTAPQGLRTSLPRSSSAVTCCCSESRRS